MHSYKAGVSDIQMYVPEPWISTEVLIRNRSRGDAALETRLQRAAAYTGQRAFHFPQVWEDSATMAAAASRDLLLRQSDISQLRYLVTGTETTVDHSKPVASYVSGMLEASGLPIPLSHTSFQVQHACAGGTLSLFSIASLLTVGGRPGESGLAICTDIARYLPSSTGEITQGAGAAALLVEKDPALIELDLGSAGYASRDVDDFFRPFGKDEARVKGQYSIRCYRTALLAAFEDHCARLGREAADILKETDHFILHVPYYSLPLDSMRMLLKKHLGYKAEQADEFLAARAFQDSIEPARDIGNLYSGSMFMSLEALLRQQYSIHGDAIAGKRILFASYGSGNTMVVFSGTVAPAAGSVVSRWPGAPLPGVESSWDAYTGWCGRHSWDTGYNATLRAVEGDSTRGFYLDSIREDGFREYGYRS